MEHLCRISLSIPRTVEYPHLKEFLEDRLPWLTMDTLGIVFAYLLYPKLQYQLDLFWLPRSVFIGAFGTRIPICEQWSLYISSDFDNSISIYSEKDLLPITQKKIYKYQCKSKGADIAITPTCILVRDGEDRIEINHRFEVFKY